MPIAAVAEAPVALTYTSIADLIALRLLLELDPRTDQYDVGRGARGVYHIIPLINLSSGRLRRLHDTTLCRGKRAAQMGYRIKWQAPTCERCLVIAERLSVRNFLFGQKNIGS